MIPFRKKQQFINFPRLCTFIRKTFKREGISPSFLEIPTIANVLIQAQFINESHENYVGFKKKNVIYSEILVDILMPDYFRWRRLFRTTIKVSELCFMAIESGRRAVDARENSRRLSKKD